MAKFLKIIINYFKDNFRLDSNTQAGDTIMLNRVFV